MNDILSELGEGPRAKLATRRLSRIIPPKLRLPPRKASNSALLERGIGAYMGAMARISAVENSRPNRAYSLIAQDPAVAIANGGTVTASFTLPTDSFLIYWICNEIDANNFIVTSLKVAGFDVVGGSPINLAAFTASVDRVDRPGPLTGRMFDGGTTIELTVRNVSGQPAFFRGLTAWMISTDCASTKKGKPAPAILSFRSLSSGFRNIFTRKGLIR
jgi:hypothetical protein